MMTLTQEEANELKLRYSFLTSFKADGMKILTVVATPLESRPGSFTVSVGIDTGGAGHYLDLDAFCEFYQIPYPELSLSRRK